MRLERAEPRYYSEDTGRVRGQGQTDLSATSANDSLESH